jgi:polyisoprenoid-binding protein YceI
MATHTWKFDNSHSRVGFSIKHMMFAKVRGQFTDWSGSLSYDPENLAAASVEATIQIASVDTSNEQRDGHLRSADFFDAEKFPVMTFKSESWKKASGKILVQGHLSMHGVTKSVELEVTENGTGIDPWGNKRIGFSALTVINRKDFGLEWNTALEAGGVLVGEDVTIEIELEATLAA